MSLRFKILSAIFAASILSLIIGLLIWDIPAPSNEIKKTLSYDQLSRHYHKS